jgi:hypothetical protein
MTDFVNTDTSKLSAQELIDFYLPRFSDFLPTREEALKMFAHLGLNDRTCLRKACWGEVIFDRSRAMDMIRVAV